MKERQRNHLLIRKTIITSILLLSLANSFAFAKERVTIKIDGESYSREMPEDYESAVELIRYLADLECNADSHAEDVEKKYADSMNSYENQISKLYDKIESLETSLSEAKDSASKTEKDVNKLTAVNSRFTIGFDVGPVFGYDEKFVVGTHTGILMDYRILRNFHIGGNVFFNAFSAQTRPFEAGLGLFIGYSLY